MQDVNLITGLIFDYIRDRGLGEGAQLPPEEKLAAEFQCDTAAVREALRRAHANRKLARGPDGAFRVAPPEVIAVDAQDPRRFSFSYSAALHGASVVTNQFLEKPQVRLPLSDESHPLYPVERHAQKALFGIGEYEPSKLFIVIARARRTDGKLKALQWVYLDPDRFPPDFLERHDFATESLISIYHSHGFQSWDRLSTRVNDRLVGIYEKNVLHALGEDEHDIPRTCLAVEQESGSFDRNSRSWFVIEYLHSVYFGITYEIKHRPPQPPEAISNEA